MDSAPSPLYYFLGCDTSVPQAMGTKRGLHPPSTTALLLVRVASICFHGSLNVLSLRTGGEREAGRGAANQMYADPQGRR